MSTKITYTNKVAIQNDETIADNNKVTAEDMNEIKQVVNDNADELEQKQQKQEGKGLSTNDFTDELKEKLEGLNNYDDTQLKQNIADIQQKQETQNTNISNLQKDNTTNKENIANIQDEQTEQNTKIQNNSNNIEALQQEKAELEAECERLREDINVLPSVSGEGENITLNGTSEARFKKLGIGGNSWQETREGYNILKNEATTQFVNGINFTVNEDKSIKASGTATANAQLFLLGNTSGTNLVLTLKANVSYKNLSGVDLIYRKVDGAYGKINNDQILTPSEDMLIGAVYIEIKSETTVDKTYYPMLIKGTEDKGYEPYGVMPSLEFPSEIQTVKDSINFTICNRNLFDKTNINELNAYFSTSVTSITSNTANRTLYVPCKPNTAYTISKIASSVFNVGYTTELPVIGTQVYNIETYTNYDTKTWTSLTTGEGAKYIVFRYLQTAQDTLTQEILDSIQIEEGSIVTNCMKHKEQNYTLNLEDLELCKIENYKDYIYHNKNDNKWHKHETIKKVILGTQDYFMNGTVLHLKLSNIFGGNLINGNLTKLVANRWTVQNTSYAHTYVNKIYVAADGTTASLYNPNLTTTQKWNEWFSENASILYGVLANPTDIEITDETLIAQLDEIENTAKSYGDVTHIYSTDEISPIFEVEARKDMQLENDNLQTQINEIKTLLSTTATSAMLLDNMQTDLESEV